MHEGLSTAVNQTITRPLSQLNTTCASGDFLHRSEQNMSEHRSTPKTPSGGGNKRNENVSMASVKSITEAWSTSQKDIDVITVGWREFIENTTFHGVKYIFEGSPFKLRRLFWVLVVLSAIVFFTTQVFLRTQEYLKHKTNINMELQFEDQLPFPAVTICNQNAYRMTKAVDMELYYFLEVVYTEDNINNIDLSKYNLTMGFDEFLSESSHQMEDLIDSCEWMGIPCDIGKDFQVLPTDFGVCYTFNGDPNAVKFIDDTASGLSLILNVEQYQHMRGPQNDAGVKMLLHSQDEIPLMKERGFALAPGTHTLASVAMTRTMSLEPPWGQCNPKAPPTSDCKISHQTRILYDNCHCTQVYMDRNALEKSQLKIQSDDCSLPCNVTEYEPSLSYAQLSNINIDKLVLTNLTKKTQVTAQFLQAKETLQRVDRDIVAHDNRTITQMLNTAQQLKQTLNNSARFLGDYAVRLSQAHQWMGRDARYVMSVLHEMEETVNMKKDYMDHLVQLCFLRTMQAFFAHGTIPDVLKQWLPEIVGDCRDSSITLQLPKYILNSKTEDELLKECISEAITGPVEVKYDDLSQSLSDGHLLCMTYIGNYYVVTKFGVEFIQPSIIFLHNLSTIYQTAVSTVFNETGHDITAYPEHEQCLSALRAYNESTFVTLTELAPALFQSYEANNEEDFYSALNHLNQFLHTEDRVDDINNLNEHIDDIQNKCWWMEKRLESYHGKLPYTNARDTFSSAQSTIYALIDMVAKVQGLLDDTTRNFDETILPAVVVAEQFQIGTTTKLDMSNTFIDIVLTRALNTVLSKSADLDSYAKSFQRSLGSMDAAVQEAYSMLYETNPPALNLIDFQRFSLLQHANTSEGGEMSSLWEELSTKQHDTVQTILGKILQTEMIHPLLEMFSNLTTLLPKLVTDIETKKVEATQYVRSCNVDDEFLMNNFLQVDIFYKELSYEEVVQNKAFELGSLLGEVGGFMGLLLGASIITLIELVDYMLLACLKRYKARTSPAPVSRPSQQGASRAE